MLPLQATLIINNHTNALFDLMLRKYTIIGVMVANSIFKSAAVINVIIYSNIFNKKNLIKSNQDTTNMPQKDAATILSNSLNNVNHELKQNVNKLLDDYQNNPKLIALPEIDFSQSDSFNTILPTILKNKDLIMPLVISKMLHGDKYYLSIYETIYKSDHKEELIISYDQFFPQKLFPKGFLEDHVELDESSKMNMAVITAKHWLESSEAAEIFNDFNGNNRTDVLCEVNKILDLTNEYISC